MPLEDKPPKAVTDFKSERIYNFALAIDRKQVALSRGTMTSDVVLIKGIRVAR